MTISLKALQKKIDYQFSDRTLLVEAFSHASFVRETGTDDMAGMSRSNQRLEFLGDRVLGLVIATTVFEAFPCEDEGKLARRYAVLVSRETLARVAEQLSLGQFLMLASTEDKAGERHNPSLLADTLEALIAALYLDGGLPEAKRFIKRHWEGIMRQNLTPPQDPKSALQEWAQARKLDLPVYRELDRQGPPHAPVFVIEVSVTGKPSVVSEGGSKRAAEITAAKKLLDEIQKKDS